MEEEKRGGKESEIGIEKRVEKERDGEKGGERASEGETDR